MRTPPVGRLVYALLLLLLLPALAPAATVTLTWDAPVLQAGQTPPEGYVVYRHEGSPPFVELGRTPLATRTYSDTRALAGRTYTYVVRASAGTLLSDPSNEVSAALPMPPRPGWTACAVEGQACAFVGTQEVAYGDGTTFVTKVLTGGTPCTNAVFGDPLPTFSKYCYVRPLQPPAGPRNLTVQVTVTVTVPAVPEEATP